MSLSNPIPRGTRMSPVYGADGVSATYAVPFWFLSALDLVVYLTPPGGGAQTVYSNSMGYTVSGENNPGGGTMTLAAIPAAGAHIQIFGRRNPNRSTAVVNGGTLVSAALELELDTIEATMQELRRDIDNVNALAIFAALPKTFPTHPGQLWNNGGVLCIS